MKTFTIDEVLSLIGSHQHGEDNEGQIIVYTGVYEWSDHTYHDEPEEREQS
jgi:hypothetical protein